MAHPIPRKDGDESGGEAQPAELDFAAVKIEPLSYPRVMGMLVGLAASTASGDLFARIKVRPGPDGVLAVVVPMPDGTRREILVPSGEWRLLTREERERAATPPPAAFDLRDRQRRG